MCELGSWSELTKKRTTAKNRDTKDKSTANTQDVRRIELQRKAKRDNERENERDSSGKFVDLCCVCFFFCGVGTLFCFSFASLLLPFTY